MERKTYEQVKSYASRVDESIIVGSDVAGINLFLPGGVKLEYGLKPKEAYYYLSGYSEGLKQQRNEIEIKL